MLCRYQMILNNGNKRHYSPKWGIKIVKHVYKLYKIAIKLCFTHGHHIKEIDWLMARTTCLVCLVSSVSGCLKNALRRGSASNGHITKLEQSTFLRYLWFYHFVCAFCASLYILLFWVSSHFVYGRFCALTIWYIMLIFQ